MNLNPPWYVRFWEHNTHERERWMFYILLDGNVQALRTLQNWIVDDEEASLRKHFGVDFEPYSLEEVTALCARSTSGYMPAHNLLAGQLDLTLIPGVTTQDVVGAILPNGVRTSPDLPEGTLSRVLYKGGIARLMTTHREAAVICAACKTEITGQTNTWDGETVHLVCPGVDFLTHPVNAYHAHIFWNEAVPGGYYGYNPEIPWEEVERQAKDFRLSVRREEMDGKVYIAVDDWH